MLQICTLFLIVLIASCNDSNQRQISPEFNADNVEVADKSQDSKSSATDDDEDFIGKSEDEFGEDENEDEEKDEPESDEEDLALGFERDILTLAQNTCEGCHSGDEPAGGIALTGSDEFEENIDAAIIAIEEESMPPEDNDLSAAADPEKLGELLKEWQEEGFPN